ncbi:protein HEAT INTOLERANT 4-like [Aristolochia californica]|uniref:protein HEAT INTOLERANT 4-like n=1 Tax=Aristolochia californica TaxID=171875 RepID=UPI0035E37BDC
MARRRATKRKTEPKAEKQSAEELPKGDKEASRRAKRVKAPAAAKSIEEPEIIEDKRNMEDLWQAAFPVGTEWDQMDAVYEIKWDFTNLENSFEEGGVLHGKKVYIFGCTEPQMVFIKGEGKVICIPAVVAVVFPFPPSDKIGVKSVQRENEEIIPMKEMKMAWAPYFPLEDRLSQVERFKSHQIFTLSCTQRRAALKHLKIERIKKYDYCLPYFYNPLKEDEEEQNTVVQIMYPTEPPVVCDFDWDMDDLEEFADEKIKDEVLPESEKEEFKKFIKEKVKESKKAQREAKEARKMAVEEMDEKTKEAYESMRFYKFYPVQKPDTPDISSVKSPFINRYYGKAHEVF